MPRKSRYAEPMRRTQLYVTEEQSRKMAFLSQDSGVAVSEHMRRAIDSYLTLPHVRDRLRRMPKVA